jgi:IS605 OrfB family transposase
MSQITVQCRLVASEETRRHLWYLMAEIYTPFINEMLARVAQHPDFATWSQEGKIPADVFEEIRKAIKEEWPDRWMPGRWSYAARDLVKRIYKSWLALRRRLRNQLAGQTRWIEILQSDDELVETCGVELEAIRVEATKILAKQKATVEKAKKPAKTAKTAKGKTRKRKTEKQEKSLYQRLFELYEKAETDLARGAIAYLLKNNCQIPQKAENPETFQKRRRKAEIRIARLTDQLARSRLPKGRDLTDEEWLKALKTATEQLPKNETEAAAWQAYLLTESSPLPFPVAYETNEDLNWSLNDKGRLCVSFNGLADYSFEVYCDTRQIHWFQRFFEDQTIKEESGSKLSAGNLTLRSGRISWQLGAGKGELWNINRLTLYCSVDTQLWTQEGTEKASQEKATKIAKIISSTKAKGDLTSKQKDFIRKREKTLELLQNPFPRPSRPLYQGSPSILVGVSFGLDKPATIAIVDITTGKVITYRSIRQLLGSNYKLLNRQRQRQHQKVRRRRSQQLKFAPNQISEGGLGDCIDSLIAKAIIQTAQQYNASSIVIPDLTNIREGIQSEVQVRAEQKSSLKEVQDKYAQEYRASVHRWSYNRLSQKIESKALQVGLTVETARQPLLGTPQEKARGVAIAGYQARKASQELT